MHDNSIILLLYYSVYILVCVCVCVYLEGTKGLLKSLSKGCRAHALGRVIMKINTYNEINLICTSVADVRTVRSRILTAEPSKLIYILLYI